MSPCAMKFRFSVRALLWLVRISDSRSSLVVDVSPAVGM